MIDATDRLAARTALRAKRVALAAAQRAQADTQICDRLLELIDALAPSLMAVYWPMLGEPDLRALYQSWHQEGRVLLLPRVVSASAPLQFVRWQAGESLEEGPHGTRQPSSGQALLPDLILLPCLGFDAARHRLGYGGGYYDRTRALMPNTCSIGIAYEESEICNFKAQPHDLPLQVIVTPNQVLGDPLGANPAS